MFMEDIRVIIDDAAARGIYRKTVLSRSTDKSIRRCTVSLFRSSHGQTEAQCEYLRQDGKAVHENFPPELLGKRITELLSGYRQADILTTAGSCTVMISHSGSMHIKNGIKTDGGERAELKTHDRDKQRFLSPDAPFLRPLGISDERGRVLDSRRSKYRQINRFLELLDDVYPKLPQKGTLTVCDLCCGKSVLAFAVYHYLTSVRGREVDMYGVDLKPDVIELSERIARESGCTGLHFVCGDVSRFTPSLASVARSVSARLRHRDRSCSVARGSVRSEGHSLNALLPSRDFLAALRAAADACTCILLLSDTARQARRQSDRRSALCAARDGGLQGSDGRACRS